MALGPPSFPVTLPSPNNTTYSEPLRLTEIKFGDGYRQSFPDGPNAKERVHTLSWDPITTADADAICAFLDDHIGVSFRYRLPRELAPRSWVWVSRQRGFPHAVRDSLTVTIEERFP